MKITPNQTVIVASIPVWAMCYICNGDIDSISAEEQAVIDAWLSRNNVVAVSPVQDDDQDCVPYFDYFPAFGLSADVIDCNVTVSN